jgi:protease I
VVTQVESADYDALIVPGGAVNPDNLRQTGAAVEFVRGFFALGKPVAAICPGPWILVEADVVRGRTLTSFPSIRTDIRNAGGTVVDREIVVHWNLVASRDPDDLPAFRTAAVDQIANSGHAAEAN